MAQPTHAAVEAKITQIETEMKKVGMWQQEPLPPEKLDTRAAFGQDKLSFEQWLQFIFIPRVREIITAKGNWPPGSQVSVQAFREWQQWGSEDRYNRLLDLLREFDAMFPRIHPAAATKQKGGGCASNVLLLVLTAILVCVCL